MPRYLKEILRTALEELFANRSTEQAEEIGKWNPDFDRPTLTQMDDKILQSRFEAEIAEAIGLYRHFVETNRATTDLETIV